MYILNSSELKLIHALIPSHICCSQLSGEVYCAVCSDRGLWQIFIDATGGISISLLLAHLLLVFKYMHIGIFSFYISCVVIDWTVGLLTVCWKPVFLHIHYLRIPTCSTYAYTAVGLVCIHTLYLMFIKKKPCPEIIFSFMYTVLLPDDGQTNMPKHVTEI